MDQTTLRGHLKTQWLGRSVHFRPSVDSTNSWALSALEEGHARRGDVFLADFQTFGHGRQDRVWESPAGKNILASFIDDAPPKTAESYQLTLVAGVAFQEGLEKLYPSIPFKLKWPNDLFIKGKKLGGILCEIRKQTVVIGVGLNVNAEAASFSPEVAKIATSLLIHLRREAGREEILASCLAAYEQWRATYDHKGLTPVLAAWNRKSALAGARVKVVEGAQGYQGSVEGLSPEGFLLVRSDGGLKTVVAGDVILLG